MSLTTQTIRHKDGHEFVVAAEITDCPRLVITQGFFSYDGKELRLAGSLALTHTITGAQLPTGGTTNLRGLASALKDLHWDFDDVGYFMANEDASNAYVSAVRAFVTAEGRDEENPWIENTKLLDAADPATSLLSNELDGWHEHYNSKDAPDLPDVDDKSDEAKAKMQAWMGWISTQVYRYGVAYLLAVLRAAAPEVADAAAKNLAANWEAGDTLGEWIYQWRDELANGLPLTLRGIPHHDIGVPQ